MKRIWRSAGLPVRVAWMTVSVFVVVAILAPTIVPYDPVAQPDVLNLGKLAPSMSHPLGTDQFSRDLFSRLLVGSRISLGIAISATAIAMVLGTAVGLLAGLGGQWLDTLVMRTVDASTAIPRLVFLIVVLSLWGAVSPLVLAVILGLTSWFQTSRIVRAEVLSLKTRTFVSASYILGIGRVRLVWRHILPHLTPQLIVATTLSIGNILLIEAGLSGSACPHLVHLGVASSETVEMS